MVENYAIFTQNAFDMGQKNRSIRASCKATINNGSNTI
jgi:hypothetical protein